MYIRRTIRPTWDNPLNVCPMNKDASPFGLLASHVVYALMLIRLLGKRTLILIRLGVLFVLLIMILLMTHLIVLAWVVFLAHLNRT